MPRPRAVPDWFARTPMPVARLVEIVIVIVVSVCVFLCL